MTATTETYGEVTWRHGRVATMTGPTDPESPFGGRTVMLTRRRCDDVQRGMLIGSFSQWHFGGRQPRNLLSVATVDAMRMQGLYDRWGAYLGQQVTLVFGERSSVHRGKDDVFEVTFH